MKPSPHDVLRALDSLKPGAAELVTGAGRGVYPSSLRRVGVAVCTALGFSLSRISRDFKRDRKSVKHHRDAYLRNRALDEKRAEAELFRALVRRAHEIAARRRVVYLSDRGRAA